MRTILSENCILKRTNTFDRKRYGWDKVGGEDWSMHVTNIAGLQDRMSSRKSEVLILDFPLSRLQLGCNSTKLRKVGLF